MATVGDLIRGSMRKIGVLAAGEALDAGEGADALTIFRQMLDGWSNESLLIPVVNTVTKTLIQGQSQYTIGIYPSPQPVPLPDNHIETARPQIIQNAFIRDTYSTDYSLTKMGGRFYSDISRKTTQARPSRYYVRDGWPLDTILFDSAPYTDDVLHLEVLQPLSEILPTASLVDVIDLPPGYERALVFNLCLDIADEWGREVTSTIAVNAVNSKKQIKRANKKDLTLRADRGAVSKRSGLGTYIISSGP